MNNRVPVRHEGMNTHTHTYKQCHQPRWLSDLSSVVKYKKHGNMKEPPPPFEEISKTL